MLEARKENKVYKIDETLKARYLKEGYDIYEDGVIVEHTPKKLIKYSDHLKALEEAKKTSVANVTELLTKYAETKNISLGSATTATGILNKILEAEKTDETSE